MRLLIRNNVNLAIKILFVKDVNLFHTVGSKIIGTPEFLLLDPMINMSCNIECCGHQMHQGVANMELSQYNIRFNLGYILYNLNYIFYEGQLYPASTLDRGQFFLDYWTPSPIEI